VVMVEGSGAFAILATRRAQPSARPVFQLASVSKTSPAATVGGLWWIRKQAGLGAADWWKLLRTRLQDA